MICTPTRIQSFLGNFSAGRKVRFKVPNLPLRSVFHRVKSMIQRPKPASDVSLEKTFTHLVSLFTTRGRYCDKEVEFEKAQSRSQRMRAHPSRWNKCFVLSLYQYLWPARCVEMAAAKQPASPHKNTTNRSPSARSK